MCILISIEFPKSYHRSCRRVGLAVRTSEPFLTPVDVSSYELLVGLSEVDDSLNDANNPTYAAEYSQNQLDDSGIGVSENELMHAESAEQNAAKTGGNLLVS